MTTSTQNADKLLSGFLECFSKTLEELAYNATIDMKGNIAKEISSEQPIKLTTDDKDTAQDILKKIEEEESKLENENNELQQKLTTENANQEREDRQDQLEPDADDMENNDLLDDVDNNENDEGDGAIGGQDEDEDFI